MNDFIRTDNINKIIYKNQYITVEHKEVCQTVH